MEKISHTDNIEYSISIETAMLFEHFQWQNEYDVSEASEELDDVLIYCI